MSSMDREKLRDKVKKDIRALLISAPLGVPAQIFAKDYRQMNGKEIPYREIGYRSLDDFIWSIPDVVRVGMGPTGLVTFYPVATKETQHIVNMIKKQKKPSIKKGVMPTAIVARKTPVKATSFSRRGGFGSRYTPRGGGGGYHRPQAKYHPRSYTQPAPNLPPRLQRVHQQSSTYQPHNYFSSSASYSHQPSSTSASLGWPSTGTSLMGAPVHQHGPFSNTSRAGSKQDGAPSRPRLSSLPEKSTNKLHPQHTLSSFASSNKPASPSVVTTTNTTDLRTLWRDELRTAHHMTVEEMNSWTKNTPKNLFQNPVCVEGVTSRHKEDMFQGKVVVKILLKSLNYRRAKSESAFEAVQLFFIAPFWDLELYPQPHELPEGSKLRAYGTALAPYSKFKERAEPAMRVVYYETLAGSGASSGSSSHSSPRESRAATPKMDVKLSELEDNIFKLLLKFEKGTYAKRLNKVYGSEYKVTPPDNILELAKAMPFVMIEKITDTDEIMHLKTEYREKRSARPTSSTAPAPSLSLSPTAGRPSKPPGIHYPPVPPHLPGTVSFSSEEDRLYEVLVCLVNSPFSFYVQLRDDEEQHMFAKMEEEMNNYFNKRPQRREVVQVKENQLYASLWAAEEDEDGQWCRAMVISQQDDNANVLFPDYGNQELVPISDLRSLPPEFYILPFQAIHCSLHGVLMEDKMQSSEAIDYFAELAANKICALQVMDSSGARVSVEILDKELEDDENINSKFISRFHPIASLAPTLPAPGEPMVAIKLTDVDETGVLSVQVVGPGLSQLEELTKQIEERYSASSVAGVTPVVGGTYCTEYSMDHCWYRVKVLKELSSGQVLVEYVDYGNEEVVDVSNLRPELNTKLFSLPSQVVKCRLFGIPPQGGQWTDGATNFLVHYIEIDELNLEVVSYCIKATAASSVALALVKLHVKDSSQEMVCVNNLMLQDVALSNLPGSHSQLDHQVEIKSATGFSSIEWQVAGSVCGTAATVGQQMAGSVEQKVANSTECQVTSLQQEQKLTGSLEPYVTNPLVTERIEKSNSALPLPSTPPPKVNVMDGGESDTVFNGQSLLVENQWRPSQNRNSSSVVSSVHTSLSQSPQTRGSSASPGRSEARETSATSSIIGSLTQSPQTRGSSASPGRSEARGTSAASSIHGSTKQSPQTSGSSASPGNRGTSAASSIHGSAQQSPQTRGSSASPGKRGTSAASSIHGSAKQSPQTRGSSAGPGNRGTSAASSIHGSAQQSPQTRGSSASLGKSDARGTASSVNVSSGVESEMSESEVCDSAKVSPNLSSSSHTSKHHQLSPVDMKQLSLVDSPKECIRDGVPYVATPVPVVTATGQSGHLAPPPSATGTSTPSSASRSPSQVKSPSPSSLRPSPVSPVPMTPPMSPPPIVDRPTQTEYGGGVETYKWAEFPSGKVVEVEVTWAPSPTNFSVLLLSVKPELDSMSKDLQRLVMSESYPLRQALCTGYVCAARYSLDGLWYRAIVRQPFQIQSMQTLVEFLDYGGSEMVPLSALKCLPERCRHLPFQAIKASLHGISGGVGNPAVVKKFEEMVYTKRLFALRKAFDASTSRVSVVLLDTSDSSERDIIINEVLSKTINHR